MNPFKKGDKWKIIFLDVDGVISIGDDGWSGFNISCMYLLKDIIEKTSAKVVISSSWRTGNLQKTKEYFPPWLQDNIISETPFDRHYVKSSFQTVRGNEIETWIHDHLTYPWYAWPEIDESYRLYNEDGNFKMMDSNRAGKDFTYCILDDDNDMLYTQTKWFIQTDSMKGLTKQNAESCIKILNQI